MKDIVLKKSSSSVPVAPALKKPELLPAPIKPAQNSLALLVEKTLTVASEGGNWLYRAIGTKNDYTVVSQSFIDTPKTKNKKKKTVSIPGKALVKKAKTKAHQAHGSLKTPIGKLAAVQAVAILALFTYVQATTNNPNNQEVRNVAATVENSSLQKYLPSIGQYTEPKAFEENLAVADQSATTPLYGWVTPWNTSAIAENNASYKSLSAFWGSVAQDGINIESKSDWTTWTTFKNAYNKEGRAHFLTVTGNPNFTYLALSNPSVQQQHIEALLKVTSQHGFDGVDIDYEALGSENKSLFTDFIRNLSTAFHASGKKVSVTVEARLANQVPMDWKALSTIADEVRIMIYDYHGKETGSPGPVSPIGWLKEVLDYAQSTIDPNKLVVGLGNYGYDWTAVTEGDSIIWKGTGVSFDQAMATATERSAPIIRSTGIDERGYDIGSTPSYAYTDPEGKQHAVWFEDNESLQAKIRLINQYKTAGIIFWSVGMGDKEFWQTHSSATN